MKAGNNVADCEKQKVKEKDVNNQKMIYVYICHEIWGGEGVVRQWWVECATYGQ